MGTKLPKVLVNAFDLSHKIQQYGNDALRYYLLRETNFSIDGDFSDHRMVSRLNGELANILGNLVSRSCAKSLVVDAKVPVIGPLSETDQAIVQKVKILHPTVDFLISRKCDIQTSIEHIWQLLASLNQYCNETKPWAHKRQGDTERTDTIMYILLESIRIISHILEPILPDTAIKLQNIFSNEKISNEHLFDWGQLKSGTGLIIPDDLILFKKMAQI